MSLPRYPEYKDSGVEWLGQVPEHWQLAKIRSFTRFFGGGTPSRENLSYWNGGIPWVSPKDMKAERIVGAEESITEDGLAASTTSIIEEGSLLIVVRSGILKHTIPVAINDLPVALNQDMKALRFAEGTATSEFFFRWVQGLNQLLLLAWAKQGATVESIEHTYLAETIVAFPPREEQVAITTFLDHETAKIDALIAEQEKLLVLLAEKRQTTISHAVTRGLDPDALMKDSGVPWLGQVPVHWKVVPLISVCNLIQTGPFGGQLHASEYIDDGVAVINPANIVNGKLIPDLSCTVNQGKADELGHQKLRIHDIVIGRRGEMGRCARVQQEGEGWLCGTGSMIVRIDKADSGFVEKILGSSIVSEVLGLESVGSTMDNLNAKILSSLRIPLPPLEDQQAIVSSINSKICKLDNLQAEVKTAIALLMERRSALIAAAVTGQIDVRGAAEGIAA